MRNAGNTRVVACMGAVDFQRWQALPGFSPTAAIKTIALAVVLSLSAFPASSSQTGSQFTVMVKQQPASPNSAFCRIGPDSASFGAIVTVVCSTGVVVNVEAPGTAVPWTPIHGGAYRFTNLTGDVMPFLGGVESYTGVGTITTWRIVNLPDREYLEMLIGW